MQKTFISTVSARGQTVVPAEVRRKLGLEAQSCLLWTIEGDAVRVTRVTDDPVEALWGVFKQPDGEFALTQDLIQEHKQALAEEAVTQLRHSQLSPPLLDKGVVTKP